MRFLKMQNFFLKKAVTLSIADFGEAEQYISCI